MRKTVILATLAAGLIVSIGVPALAAGQEGDLALGESRIGWLMDRPAREDRALVGYASDQMEIGDAIPESVKLDEGNGSGGRNKFLHILSSAVMPGSGEAMLGYKRGYVMMAADIFAWTQYIHYGNRGDDLKQEFFDYADQHWSLYKLTAAYSGESNSGYTYDPNVMENDQGVPLGQAYLGVTSIHDVADLDSLNLYVSKEADKWEYYENLGKWDQFVFGWDDFINPYDSVLTGGYVPTGTIEDLRQFSDSYTTSRHREEYRIMRGKSDDAYAKQDNWLLVNIGLRVFSVLQTAYLEGVLGGQPRGPLEVSGHEVSFHAQPVGWGRGTLAAAVSF